MSSCITEELLDVLVGESLYLKLIKFLLSCGQSHKAPEEAIAMVTCSQET